MRFEENTDSSNQGICNKTALCSPASRCACALGNFPLANPSGPLAVQVVDWTHIEAGNGKRHPAKRCASKTEATPSEENGYGAVLLWADEQICER